MKKIILTAFVISMFSVATFADGTDPQPQNCGHINNPVFVCEPPPQPRDSEDADKSPSGEESTIEIIKTFIAEHNPFGYFLN